MAELALRQADGGRGRTLLSVRCLVHHTLVHEGGFELLTTAEDPDVMVVRAHNHLSFVVIAIVAPIGAAAVAWFGRWELAGFCLVLAFLALLMRARRTVIDRRTRVPSDAQKLSHELARLLGGARPS